MSHFTFKNSSKSLSGNTFAEWVKSFNASFLHFCLTKIVAFQVSDKYPAQEDGKRPVLDTGATVAIFPNDAETRLNFLADKKLWGKWNKPLVSLDKTQLLQLVAGEWVTMEATKYSFAVKLTKTGNVRIERAYKVDNAVFVHPTGLLVDLNGLNLTELANSLRDKPLASTTKTVSDSIDLTDLE